MSQKPSEILAGMAALAAPPTPEISPGFDVIAAKLTAEVERLKGVIESHVKDISRFSRTTGELRQDRDAWKRRAEEARARGPADSIIKDRDGLRNQVSILMREVADLKKKEMLSRESMNEAVVKRERLEQKSASERASLGLTLIQMQVARDRAQGANESAIADLERVKTDLLKSQERIKTLTDAASNGEKEVQRLRSWLGRISAVGFHENGPEEAVRDIKEMARNALAGAPGDHATRRG